MKHSDDSDNEDGSDSQKEVDSAVSPKRGPRPLLPTGGLEIIDWKLRDLVALAEWIQSDGQLRTHEELKRELMEEIGISRRGSRVARVLDQVVAALDR